MDSRMAFPYLLCPSPSRPHLCSTGALMVTARGLDLLPAAPRHLAGSARPTFSWGCQDAWHWPQFFIADSYIGEAFPF
jgi:hypothetical protein